MLDWGRGVPANWGGERRQSALGFFSLGGGGGAVNLRLQRVLNGLKGGGGGVTETRERREAQNGRAKQQHVLNRVSQKSTLTKDVRVEKRRYSTLVTTRSKSLGE